MYRLSATVKSTQITSRGSVLPSGHCSPELNISQFAYAISNSRRKMGNNFFVIVIYHVHKSVNSAAIIGFITVLLVDAHTLLDT